MMRVLAVATTLTLVPVSAFAQQAGAASAPPWSNSPIVQIGLFGYRADGTVSGTAHDTTPSLSSIVYANAKSCLMGAGDRPAPAEATDAWQFSGKLVSSTAEEATVQLEWRRIKVGGLPLDVVPAAIELKLRRNEPIQLDHVVVETSARCTNVAVAFEARYEPRLAAITGPRGGVGASASRVYAVGGGGGRSSVRIEGAAASGATGSGGSAKLTGNSQMFDVNLWLVRSVPGQPDDVTHSTLKMNHMGASFAFAPIAVKTTRGEAMAQVTGSLSITGQPGGEQLVFSTVRRLIPMGSGQTPRDTAPDSQGTARIVNRLPGPGEVLSFEMPPFSVNGETVAPDILSIRVSMTPRS
jgi:hypothetical protein